MRGARTKRAWRCDHRCERWTGGRTKPSIRPCGSGRRRGGLASLPSDRGGIPPVECAGADRACSRCLSAGGALAAQAFSKKMRQTKAPSTDRQRGGRSEALTASAPVVGEHITDMVGFVKRLLAFPLTLSSPRARHGVRLFFGRTAVAKPARPRVKHGATARFGVASGMSACRGRRLTADSRRI